jgi:anti-sigma factor RsiW
VKDECRDITAFLDAYVDGELAAAPRRVFEAHIAECPDCAHYLASYRLTRALTLEALAEAPGAPVSTSPVPAETPRSRADESLPPERLIQAILAARRQGGTGGSG